MDLEKALKARKGQRKAQLEKDKNDRLRALQQQTGADSEGARRAAEQIRQLLKLEEAHSSATEESVGRI